MSPAQNLSGTHDEADVNAAHALQDAFTVEQDEKRECQVPDWGQGKMEKTRNTINILAPFATDSSKKFGRKEELAPLSWLLVTTVGWGGLPAKDSTYTNGFPE